MVQVANGLPETSVASASLASITALIPEALRGQVMSSFPHTLIGLGPFSHLGYKIVFTKTGVLVVHPEGQSILEGWQESEGPKLWYFPLCNMDPDGNTGHQPSKPAPGPSQEDLPMSKPIKGVIPGEFLKTVQPPANIETVPGPKPPAPTHSFKAMDETGQACFVEYVYGVDRALSAMQKASKTFNPCILDLPSVGALAGFYHACLGFLVKQTWLEAIKAGNLDSFKGLTYSNAAWYCPDLDETIKRHMAQQCQNVQSTKPKQQIAPPLAPKSDSTQPTDDTPSNQIFVRTYPISKLYTNNTGCFPV